MTEDEARTKAENLFHTGYTCAQSVAGVFAEELGFDKDTVLKLAQPFGGGMCRMRETCGTVSGMLMVAGLVQGTSDGSKTSKDEVYKTGQSLAAQFKDEHGSIICRELLGLVPIGTSDKALAAGTASAHTSDTPVSSERTADYYKKRPCEKLCGDAAVIVRKWLDARAASNGSADTGGSTAQKA
jgi:C_GCAxxG_C_C family probable redox protein